MSNKLVIYLLREERPKRIRIQNRTKGTGTFKVFDKKSCTHGVTYTISDLRYCCLCLKEIERVDE